MTVVDALVPFFAVILGAAITYWLNIRLRRHTLIEDSFTEATAALSLMLAASEFVPSYGKWHASVSEEERIALEKEIAREATVTFIRSLSVARGAVAKCIPYRPSLGYVLDEPALYLRDHASEIIVQLQSGRER